MQSYFTLSAKFILLPAVCYSQPLCFHQQIKKQFWNETQGEAKKSYKKERWNEITGTVNEQELKYKDWQMYVKLQ
jgi:hypothetical protein